MSDDKNLRIVAAKVVLTVRRGDGGHEDKVTMWNAPVTEGVVDYRRDLRALYVEREQRAGQEETGEHLTLKLHRTGYVAPA